MKPDSLCLPFFFASLISQILSVEVTASEQPYNFLDDLFVFLFLTILGIILPWDSYFLTWENQNFASW